MAEQRKGKDSDSLVSLLGILEFVRRFCQRHDNPTRMCKRFHSTYSGPYATLGASCGPSPRSGKPKWRADLKDFLFLGTVIVGHLHARGSSDHAISFLLTMTSLSYSINLPPEKPAYPFGS